MYQVKIQKMNQLKQRITNTITSMDPHELQRVLLQWRTHIEMCFEQMGSHIEHII